MTVDTPDATMEWLTAEENPAVSVLTQTALLRHELTPDLRGLWERRNEYAPVAEILGQIQPGGSWASPGRDYQKYGGSLWQVHFLGELYANGDDDRVQSAAGYAFSRQLADGSWSCTNMRPGGSITCLTANVGRALARLGHAEDERVRHALEYCVQVYRQLGCVDCVWGPPGQLNGYCHMLTPKLLLFLAEVPRAQWPDGAEDLRDACIGALRDKQIVNCLPAESREFQDLFWSTPTGEREGLKERFLAEHPSLSYGPKQGWLRFGYPLSYNSDVLEALAALAAHGEPRRPEYEEALAHVMGTADAQWRWTQRNTFNGKMLADVEQKGQPSRWLTLRALRVLDHFAECESELPPASQRQST